MGLFSNFLANMRLWSVQSQSRRKSEITQIFVTIYMSVSDSKLFGGFGNDKRRTLGDSVYQGLRAVRHDRVRVLLSFLRQRDLAQLYKKSTFLAECACHRKAKAVFLFLLVATIIFTVLLLHYLYSALPHFIYRGYVKYPSKNKIPDRFQPRRLLLLDKKHA